MLSLLPYANCLHSGLQPRRPGEELLREWGWSRYSGLLQAEEAGYTPRQRTETDRRQFRSGKRETPVQLGPPVWLGEARSTFLGFVFASVTRATFPFLYLQRVREYKTKQY